LPKRQSRHIETSTVSLTVLALVAFASNSLLTRLAVGSHAIDAGSFNAVRFLSGALVLAAIVRGSAGGWRSLAFRSFAGPLTLVLYAIPFTFGYGRIGAAAGALVLFGAVQLMMVGYGIWRGERLAPLAWTGLVVALAGLALLTLGSGRPDPSGVLLMMMAGAAWGAYSVVGRRETDSVASNARNFLWSAPLMLLVPLSSGRFIVVTALGLMSALTCGVLGTACGYIVWYRALRGLSVTAASVSQLGVPVIAAAGAAMLLGEPVTRQLVTAGITVLGGIALVFASRRNIPSGEGS
jgi:drug/metabolite transporter (DMT)-like permease